MDNLTGIIKHPNESDNEIVIFLNKEWRSFLNNSEKFTEVEDGLKLSISKNDFYAAINMILDILIYQILVILQWLFHLS